MCTIHCPIREHLVLIRNQLILINQEKGHFLLGEETDDLVSLTSKMLICNIIHEADSTVSKPSS